MLYRVYKIQTLTTMYEVEANNEDEAINLARGNGIPESDCDNEITFEVEEA